MPTLYHHVDKPGNNDTLMHQSYSRWQAEPTLYHVNHYEKTDINARVLLQVRGRTHFIPCKHLCNDSH